MNISLQQLRVFQAVAAERNFSRAGDRIGLTQPAVSRAVTELENQLGLRLFDRTTREVAPTDAGRQLAAHLERLLDELDTALLDVQGLGRQRRGRVRVASSPTLSAALMPACIAAAAADGTEIVLLDRIQQDALDSVRSGTVDFGVVVDPADPAGLHCEPILREPFCLVCPADHALAQGGDVAWSRLAEHPLVLLDQASGSRRLIDEALARQGVAPQVVQQLGHPTTVFRMVESGIGVAVLPALALASWHSPGLVARRLLPRIDREIMLVHREHRSLSPLAQQVWALVADIASRMQPSDADRWDFSQGA
ncbi:LysR family transcriptional regulator [Xylophilus rhododendri]|uniref:LysR family transcriptional regulator n=1 Tax=Xylophilus rhododendri TaxID=2697032 RepID=A0A857JG65_9BURK|nr:LysR family transcriptional regulator [Xylophilus rhododendri]QHJ01656.1 LysR family transcriptional regulator [Xylophilus rhododendri]